jgi:transcriptional regulator with XRE-family HTH domain
MKKKTLGQVLKQRRAALALSQRQAARRLGIRASHVGYLEKGRRRPSLALLRRIARVFGLDSFELFLLSHPEAKYLIRSREPAEPKPREDAWRRFVADRVALRSNHVTPGELRVLKQVNMLRRVASARHFLFILNAIRQAAAEE